MAVPVTVLEELDHFKKETMQQISKQGNIFGSWATCHSIIPCSGGFPHAN
ncbi:hypothetical protein [Nitrosomonas marina]